MVLCPVEEKNNVLPSECINGESSSYSVFISGPKFFTFPQMPSAKS
jgi:hypothetical protein